MSRINLLPWREEVRKSLNYLFFLILGGCVGLSVVVIVIVDTYISYRIGAENANIAYINNEMKDVKTEVIEVQKLQENKKRLIERMNVIQLLQVDRTSIVKLLDTIPHALPENVYLTELSRKEEVEAQVGEINPAEPKNKIEPIKLLQKKYLITVQGVSITNGGISDLLKNLDAIKGFSDIKLDEVSINKNGEGLSFKLEFVQSLTEVE